MGTEETYCRRVIALWEKALANPELARNLDLKDLRERVNEAKAKAEKNGWNIKST